MLTRFLAPEAGLLAFQERVLALATDPATPLAARLRFLAIVAANIDELFMVRMPELRAAALGPAAFIASSDDGLSPVARLELVRERVRALIDASAQCAADVLAEASVHGTVIRRWSELGKDDRTALSSMYHDELQALLTPLAMTLSPGHPLPHLAHLSLSLAVIFRHGVNDRSHFAEVELPPEGARFFSVSQGSNEVITAEELLRSHLDRLYPGAIIEGTYLFRVTRAGDLPLDEANADSLIEAISAATQRRPWNPAVRVEVERDTPPAVVNLILESLRRDLPPDAPSLTHDDVYRVDGLLDHRCLAALPLPNLPELDYAPLADAGPSPAQSMFDEIRARDLLVHHPDDSFDRTVVRFICEAANDPEVAAIKITLYRVGDPSPIVAALLHAASTGKRVVAFVELKARFDETHNIAWARALEDAGAHIVHGIAGLKTHAKLALVVRREGGRPVRYVHVGTGNYNVRSGRQYTDLSLFSTREDICEDVADLFNQLTGASREPQPLFRGSLVAPSQLLPNMLALMATEAGNARAGKPSGICIKVNGLSDPDVVNAIYDASMAGVPVDLIVRGICTLRPGVPGMSETITVRSLVGRFLEHSRIYRFTNGGQPRYFIGSADLRPRNLRRRVELLVPVTTHEHQQRLDEMFAGLLARGDAWHLASDGTYVRSAAFANLPH